MGMPLSRPEISAALGGIRDSLAEADKIAFQWDAFLSSGKSIDSTEELIVSHYVETAFIQTMVLLEAAGLPEALKAVQSLNVKARSNYATLAHAEEFYLKWSPKLSQHLDAIENAVGAQKIGTITKDVVQILRGTLYAITDPRCFSAPPDEERDVHVRIEAVLRCIFPDLRHKPPISKPIKNFEPDTGLPSLRTLIEYKYIKDLSDAKVVSDQVLADTRGYTSKDWDHFVYVIYETTRIKREEEWIEHLRENGVGEDTKVIVLSGEPAPKTQSATEPPDREQPTEESAPPKQSSSV